MSSEIVAWGLPVSYFVSCHESVNATAKDKKNRSSETTNYKKSLGFSASTNEVSMKYLFQYIIASPVHADKPYVSQFWVALQKQL